MAQMMFIVLVTLSFLISHRCQAKRVRTTNTHPSIFLSRFTTREKLEKSNDDSSRTELNRPSILSTIGRSEMGEQSPLSDIDMADIQQSLEEFGLLGATSDGKTGPAKQFMVDLYKKLEEGEDVPHAAGHSDVDVAILRADTIRGLEATDARKASGQVILHFNLSSISNNEITKKAELRLRVDDKSNDAIKFRIKINVFRNGEQVDTLKYTTKGQRSESADYAFLDLTSLLGDVLRQGHSNTTIEVKIRPKRSSRRRNRRSALSEIRTDDPLLIVYTKDSHFFEKFIESHNLLSQNLNQTHSTRAKRSAKSERSLCNKKDFVIDFDAVGWGDWIIHPKRYNAYHCQGKCPTPVEQSYTPTNHAMLQSIVRLTKKDIPRPCCVPSKLKPLSMLYYEFNEIVVRHHPDMVVDECGCR